MRDERSSGRNIGIFPTVGKKQKRLAGEVWGAVLSKNLRRQLTSYDRGHLDNLIA